MPTDAIHRFRPMPLRISLLLVIAAAVAACERKSPAPSVTELMENPILLEATLVRCAENRAERRYAAECVNARDALQRIAGEEERARREELERLSAEKREAARRRKDLAAEAERRALEAERRREEAAYLEQFGERPAPGAGGVDAASVNAPAAVLPSAGADGTAGDADTASGSSDLPLPVAGSNAPLVEIETDEPDDEDSEAD